MITYENELHPETYNELRELVGWCRIAERRAEIGLNHSYYLIAAKDGEKTVGMACVISDGGYVAYIADVVVHPDYQRQGIGREMLLRLMRFLRQDLQAGERMMVCLGAAAGKEPFYKLFGFEERHNAHSGAGMSQWIESDM